MKKSKLLFASIISINCLIFSTDVCAQAAKDILKASENIELLGIHPKTDKPQIFMDTLEFGTPFFVQELEIGVTGKIESDIYTNNGYFSSKEITIPSGTPVFAVNFKVKISGATGGYAVGNGIHHVVKWCGEIDKPSKRLNGGKGFCIPYKYDKEQRSAMDNMMFEIPPYIETIGISKDDEPSSIYFPDSMGVGANIISNYKVIEGDYKFDVALKLTKSVELTKKEGFVISDYNIEGSKKILTNQTYIPLDQNGIARIDLSGASYQINKISNTQYKIIKIN